MDSGVNANGTISCHDNSELRWCGRGRGRAVFLTQWS